MSRTTAFCCPELYQVFRPASQSRRNPLLIPSLSMNIRREHRRLHSFHRNTGSFYLPREWSGARACGGLAAILLAAAGVSYGVFTSRPLKLESDESEFLGGKEIAERYLPPIPPYTIEQANEALRWVCRFPEKFACGFHSHSICKTLLL